MTAEDWLAVNQPLDQRKGRKGWVRCCCLWPLCLARLGLAWVGWAREGPRSEGRPFDDPVPWAGTCMVPVSLPPLVASDCRAGVREEVWLWVEGGDFGKPPFGPLFLFVRPAGLNGM